VRNRYVFKKELPIQAAEAFPNPVDGWTYLYSGDQLQIDEPALDGTWTHDNGSDAFKGDPIGGVLDPVNNPDNAPGGAILLTNGATKYLRIQDTGDPRDYDGSETTWEDPSNRKIYFGHYLSQELPDEDSLAILDNGVTLTFRARIPTPAKAGGPLDPLHRDGRNTAGTYPNNGVLPYPEGGDGYLTSDGAKGNFVIRQIGDGTPDHPGAAIALSLTVPTDTPGGNPDSGRAGFAGLTMNERNGPNVSGAVDFGEGSGENNFALDPTDWHEFWICIRKTRDPIKAGATHDVFVFRDGNLEATSHKVTAGDGSDLDAGSFIATGGSATPQNYAIDIDWFGYKKAFTLPQDGKVPPDVTVTPVGGTMSYAAQGGLTIDVEALMPGSSIKATGFQMTLNGADVSNQLTLTGTDNDAFRTAKYTGLTANRLYTAVVRVTDSSGLTTEVVSEFDTFITTSGMTIESEDYNFDAGSFQDVSGPGGYMSLMGTPDVDFLDSTMETFNEAYRTADAVDMDDGTDVTRQVFTEAGVPDYQVNGITPGEWLNYTRTFPNKVYTPYLRAGAGADRQLRLDRVTGDKSQPNQTTKPVGLFLAAQTRTVNTYQYLPLVDAFGTARSLRLSGQTTLRLTAVDVQDDVNHNYLLFLDAGAEASVLPWASSVAPAPNAQDVAANAVIAVSLADGDSPVKLESIQMLFDGNDVTADLNRQDTAAGADVSFNPGGMASGTTHTVQLTYGDTTGGTESRTWSFKIAGTLSTGIKIAWVSFHPADNTPSTDAAAAGFTEAPDVGYTRLLAEQGHAVTRIVTSGTPDTALLNTLHLVVISRSVPSGDYQDPAETLAWNGITAPTMILGGYILRGSRLGFTTGDTIPDTAGSVSLKAVNPEHPIFAGVTLDRAGVMVNPYANLVSYNGTAQRGISVNTDPLADGGVIIATIATAGDPAANGMAIAEWPKGAVMHNRGDTLGGRRLVFLSGSREQTSGLTSQGAGIYDLADDGAKLFLNAVNYMTKAPAVQPKLAISRDQMNVIVSWEPAGGTLESSQDLTTWTPVPGAASPATLPIGNTSVFYRVKQ